MKKTLLHTENLSVGYASGKVRKLLIEDINVAMQEGELVCLLGQNGVGKSTLLRTLTHLQPALAGKVFLDSRPITHISPQELSKKVSLVLTDSVQAGALTVTELIALGRSPYTSWTGHLSDNDWARVTWAIDAARINYIVEKHLYELSDGQLQKVMIARALAQDSDLMILDEPTAHLDLNNRVEIMSLLRDLTRSTGKAILVATHELQLTLQLADKLWLTNFQQPLVHGTPEDLALQGHLESTFYHENFEFDVRTGKATLPKVSCHTVSLSGTDDDWLYWTRNALSRAGYSVADEASVQVSQSANGRWEVIFGDEIRSAISIEQLLEELLHCIVI